MVCIFDILVCGITRPELTRSIFLIHYAVGNPTDTVAGP